MPLSVLITQCLQHDFVGPRGPHEPLPNKLHVGSVEARRLLGEDPTRGPVAQLLAWARGCSSEELAIVHVRDWHDDRDARQREHLEQFGAHCVRGTPGAEFVFPTPGRADEVVLDALDLNDFEETPLSGVLEQLRARSPDGKLRVAVVGVWTEAKVTFLLYDLRTRGRVEELATSSALCASASRAQHFNALSQLERILGVRVFDGVGDLAQWLRADAALPAAAPASAGFGPKILGATLTPEETDVLGDLYRDAVRLELAPLGGGFSGARVFRVRSFDSVGHEHAPSVAKIGDRKPVAQERVAFERVEGVLGNRAPRIQHYVDLGVKAGIRYGYAAMGRGEVRTFRSLYMKGAPVAEIERVLREVFEEVLAPFFAAARFERLPLLEHYGFQARFAASVRRNVTAIAGDDGPTRFADLVDFYERFLPGFVAPPEHRYVSMVHGDLNGANILIDARDNVWVIDWFHAAPSHALKDLIKLENDVLFLYTPIADAAELAEATRLSDLLRVVEDLRAPLPELPAEIRTPALRRAWDTVRVLRSLVAQQCRDDRDPHQHHVGALRYAAHTLSFDEASPWQKRWALYAADRLAAAVQAHLERNQRLRADPIPQARPGALALTMCPGRRDRGREASRDLADLRAAGFDTLVCLLPDDELHWLGVPDLLAQATAQGFGVRQVPVVDQQAPGWPETCGLAEWIGARLAEGAKIVMHCRGGLGRAGTVAACVLIDQGHTADDAVAAVRAARDARAIETAEQLRFVQRYAEHRRQN